MDEVRAVGGRVPEESVREVIENLVHADYRGVVISVSDGGNVVRVSDKGPGAAQRPGDGVRPGATPEALRDIRGVGAGLGIAKAEAEKVGDGDRRQHRRRHRGDDLRDWRCGLAKREGAFAAGAALA